MAEEKEQQKKKDAKIQEIIERVSLSWQKDLKFRASYGIPTAPPHIIDEPPERGGSGEGPNASRLLAAAVGNCLSSSLAFCLKRGKIELKDLRTDIEVTIARNERGYLRVKSLKVDINPGFKTPEDAKRADRCKQIFQDYCIVTESVRKGIPVEVAIAGPGQ